MTRVARRLAELGIELPVPPKPVAAYVPAVRTGASGASGAAGSAAAGGGGGLIYISGQIPFVAGKVAWVGPVPSRVTVEDARLAARQCAINALAVLDGELDGDLDRVARIVRLGVFVCSDAGFVDQPKVANGASELLVEIFGEAGRHARAAVGSIALPLGATVEIEMIAEVKAESAK